MILDFGEYDNQVKEVLNAANDFRGLWPGKPPEGIQASIIHDLHLIPTDDDYYEYGDNRLNWRDILEDVTSKYYAIEFERYDNQGIKFPYYKFFENQIDELSAKYRNILPKVYLKRHINETIAYYFVSCARSRLVMGKSNVLFESLFKISQSGGYPCGWEGHYPEGRLIAFYPQKPILKKDILA
jgi:hypothetical protein